MRSAQWVAVTFLACAAAGAQAIQGQGLVASADQLWPRWQGRLALGTHSPLFPRDTMNADSHAPNVRAATLLGDYYFARSLRSTGTGSGFRATSGVFLGSRSTSLLSTGPTVGLGRRAFSVDRRSLGGISPPGVDGPADQAAVPYVGLGYTGASSKTGWGFSADFGLMALAPGSAVKLGRGSTGGQSLDDALREMRLSPLVQLGVSYSF
jgi:hypothetical protein